MQYMQYIQYLIIIVVMLVIALSIVRTKKKDYKIEVNKLVKLVIKGMLSHVIY